MRLMKNPAYHAVIGRKITVVFRDSTWNLASSRELSLNRPACPNPLGEKVVLNRGISPNACPCSLSLVTYPINPTQDKHCSITLAGLL